MRYGLKVALRHLTSNLSQTGLLVFGVAVAVFIFIFMMMFFKFLSVIVSIS